MAIFVENKTAISMYKIKSFVKKIACWNGFIMLN